MDKFIRQIAKKAVAAVKRRFGKDKAHYHKSEHRGDAVSKADLLAEKVITSAIKKVYPDHGIIAEESGYWQSGAEYLWTIDPIDGTLNFVNDVPLFGVMIALVHKGDVALSTIYLPMSDELFFAKKGKGAFVNGKRTYCSSVSNFSFSTGIGPTWLRPRFAKFMTRLIKESKNKHIVFNGIGSMAFDGAYVASGRRDWFVNFNAGIHDFAPVGLLLKESGCTVTDTKGSPWKFGQLEMVAANPALHPQLLKLTKN